MTSVSLRRARLIASLASLLLTLNADAQELRIEPRDEYARLIFEPVALPDANRLVANSSTGTASTAPDASPAATSAAKSEPGRDTAGDTLGETLEEIKSTDLSSVDQYDAAIDQTLENEGLYSEALREQYLALGLLQQRIGEHEAAITTFENSMHIARVNEGLFTARQIDDVQHILRSLRAIGEPKREAEFRGYLYYVQQKAYQPGDPRLLVAMKEWADWNLSNYQQSSSARPNIIRLQGSGATEELVVIRNTKTGDIHFVPRRSLMSPGGFGDDINTINPAMVVDERLQVARDTYNGLLAANLNTTNKAPLDTVTSETIQLNLVDAEYSLKRQMEALIGLGDSSSIGTTRRALSRQDFLLVHKGYLDNVATLQSMIDARVADPSTDPLLLAQAYLNLADLHIAYDESGDASDLYNQAHAVLTAAGLETEAIQNFMHPEPLVPTPWFATHLHSRELFGISPDDTLQYRGYIDVTMNINRFGDVRGAKILLASDETPRKVRRSLLDYLRIQKMRPALVSGKLAPANDLTMRFYYSY